MTKKPIPSPAQARFLAHAWADQKDVKVGGYVDPTCAACVKYGWLVPTEETGVYPNGSAFVYHAVSVSAEDALEDYFRERRYKRFVRSGPKALSITETHN